MNGLKTCDWPDCTQPAEAGGAGYAVGADQARAAELCRVHGSLWERMVAQQHVDEVRKLAVLLHH